MSPGLEVMPQGVGSETGAFINTSSKMLGDVSLCCLVLVLVLCLVGSPVDFEHKCGKEFPLTGSDVSTWFGLLIQFPVSRFLPEPPCRN
ncbi:hypothetical protein GN956_G5198 [Arapaima gigas]